MKRFFFVLICALYLCTVAFALPSDFDVYSFDEILSDSDIVIDDSEPVLVGDNVVYPDDIYLGVSSPLDGSITDVQVMSLNPITPEDTSGLKAVLLDLIGDYDAVVVEYEYQSSNGYSNYLREVQPDYVWLCSCGLFAIVIYCLFRLGGALLRD